MPDEVLRDLERAVRADDPWIGRVLEGRYRIARHLADGGMGKVYLAEHVALAMPVAVKLLDARGASDPQVVARFEREARATARLCSPHVVRVLDWGALPGAAHGGRAGAAAGRFLVLELLPGADLASVLLRTGLFGIRRTLHVLRQIARAIDHAHAQGIVHRDLKPENVMVDEAAGDFVKVFDFGVARELHGERSFSSYGEIVGTPEYMSPEQALGAHERVGPPADRWALAAIALEMLTGDLPYPGGPAASVLRMIAEAPPRRPSELGVRVAGLDAVFDRAMARRPQDRHASAEALVDDLSLSLAPLAAREEDPRASGVDRRSGGEVRQPAPAAGAIELRARPGSVAEAAADDASMVRVAAALALGGLMLLGSAFAAGWVACLALAP